MSRPVDWTPLVDRDPVPGDHLEVAAMGRHYTRVADSIERAASNLRRLADSPDMKSNAVDAFRDNAEQVASDISRAHDRYAGVGEALTAYAPLLEQAQADSLSALRAAQTADAARDMADRKVESAQQQEDSAADESQAATHRADRTRAEREAGEAAADLAAARRALDRAVEARDTAARKAVSAIKDVEDTGDLNDGWWDNWGHKVVEFIQKVAGWVALIAGVLALVVGWIPIIGQVLAGILGTIALVASAVSLLCNIALASTGYGDWMNVVWDAVSVATFGLGRVFGAAAKGASAGLKGSSRLASGRLAAQTGGRNLRVLAGSDDLANLSRGQARGLVRSMSRQVTAFGTPRLTTALRSLRSVPSSFTDDLAALRAAPWGSVGTQTMPALRTLVGEVATASPRVTLARLYGETGVVDDLARLSGVAPEVRAMDEVSSAIRMHTVSTSTAIGSNVAGNLNDFREGFGKVVPDADVDLHLGSVPLAR